MARQQPRHRHPRAAVHLGHSLVRTRASPAPAAQKTLWTVHSAHRPRPFNDLLSQRMAAGQQPAPHVIKRLRGHSLQAEQAFQTGLARAHAYHLRHGNLAVPKEDVPHGYPLGQWIANLRASTPECRPTKPPPSTRSTRGGTCHRAPCGSAPGIRPAIASKPTACSSPSSAFPPPATAWANDCTCSAPATPPSTLNNNASSTRSASTPRLLPPHAQDGAISRPVPKKGSPTPAPTPPNTDTSPESAPPPCTADSRWAGGSPVNEASNNAKSCPPDGNKLSTPSTPGGAHPGTCTGNATTTAPATQQAAASRRPRTASLTSTILGPPTGCGASAPRTTSSTPSSGNSSPTSASLPR